MQSSIDPHVQQIIHKLQLLSAERMAEVEDFIDFLNYKDHEQPLTQAALAAAEPSFRKIWDNPEDADYDHL
jgi:hypothetical protein